MAGGEELWPLGSPGHKRQEGLEYFLKCNAGSKLSSQVNTPPLHLLGSSTRSGAALGLDLPLSFQEALPLYYLPRGVLYPFDLQSWRGRAAPGLASPGLVWEEDGFDLDLE